MTYSEHLERETEQTRAAFERTLEELRARISPGQLVDQLTEYARGGPTADFLRLPFRHFIHPDDLPATEAVIRQLQDGRPVVRFRNRFRDVRGDYRQFEWTSKSVPEEGLMFAVARDVTPTYQE